MTLELTINGKKHHLNVTPDMPLLWVIRDHLGLTGTKFGCGVAQCGACTVHVDDAPRRSCVTPASSVVGKNVTTIEGLEGPEAEAIRKAWVDLAVPQCGYCQSGQIMSAVSLLKKVTKPSEPDINRALAGNICRCATYMRIRRAILKAADEKTP